ncbi:hypothetical protein INR49_009782 [Caranx melampygus]|nr:hypothetical protein INR49_009782 [Caranx melampygus]
MCCLTRAQGLRACECVPVCSDCGVCSSDGCSEAEAADLTERCELISDRLMTLEDELQTAILNQDHALTHILSLLSRYTCMLNVHPPSDPPFLYSPLPTIHTSIFPLPLGGTGSEEITISMIMTQMKLLELITEIKQKLNLRRQYSCHSDGKIKPPGSEGLN